MSLLGLSKQWKDLVGKAKAKQLKPDEYTGGTFTITNLGMFGKLSCFLFSVFFVCVCVCARARTWSRVCFFVCFRKLVRRRVFPKAGS